MLPAESRSRSGALARIVGLVAATAVAIAFIAATALGLALWAMLGVR